MSAALQVKLLRVLQERQFEPLGATRPEPADIRVIAASHRDLRAMVQSGQFRQDLYYRVKVMKLDLPPLRQRREDIALLTQHFISLYDTVLHNRGSGVSGDVSQVLSAYDYPGNVRELQNIIEHAFVLLQEGDIELQHLPGELAPVHAQQTVCRLRQHALDATDAESIRQAILLNGGNRLAAARQLGIHKSTLFRRIRELGIELPKLDGRSHPGSAPNS